MRKLLVVLLCLVWCSAALALPTPGHHWPLNETLEDVAGTNDGFIIGSGYSWNPDGSLYLSGDGTMVNFGDPSNTGVYGQVLYDYDGPLEKRGMSFVTWVKLDGTQPIYGGLIGMVGTAYYVMAGLEFYNDSNGLGYMWSGGYSNIETGLTMPTDQWVMIAGTFDYGGANIYLWDGQTMQSYEEWPSGAFCQDSANGWIYGDLILGAHTEAYGASRACKGSFRDAQVYYTRLSADEVMELATIPEPATMSLLGLGGVALLRRRR